MKVCTSGRMDGWADRETVVYMGKGKAQSLAMKKFLCSKCVSSSSIRYYCWGSGSDSNPGLHYVRLKEPFDDET